MSSSPDAALISLIFGIFIFIFIYVIAGLVTGLIGYAVAASKGRGGFGFFLGFFLSLIGIIIAAVLEPSPEERRRREVLANPSGQAIPALASIPPSSASRPAIPGHCANCNQPISGALCASCGFMNKGVSQ